MLSPLNAPATSPPAWPSRSPSPATAMTGAAAREASAPAPKLVPADQPQRGLVGRQKRNYTSRLMSIDWNKLYEGGREYRPMSDLLLEDILAKTALRTGRALDIGCGTGELAIKLAQHGFTVTGTDVSSVALDKARIVARDENIEFLEAATANLRNTLIDSWQFELITCEPVFAFIEEKENFLDWVKCHLPSRGWFLLITPVLHTGRHYNERDRRIGVNLNEVTTMLHSQFRTVTEVHREYFGLQGDERTFIAKP